MAQSSPSVDAKRVEELKHLQKLLPACPAFDKWLKTTGELPPDFDAMPSVPLAQDPLVTVKDGRPHRVTLAEWPARRQELAEGVEDWLVGHAPPAPGNVRAVVEKKGQELGREAWDVRLEFGPDHKATLTCKLFLPTGDRPAPVFLVDNRQYALWAKWAAEKGFAICIYYASDPAYMHPDDSQAYADLFGPCDWSAFRRRAWSASRAVDWLTTLDFIDAKKIIIGGHSRSAKQAMIAAAYDDRIAAVVASSPGSGGSMPYRYCDGSTFGESVEVLTGAFPDWVSMKVRLFAGRENKLPADSHYLYALIAPRPVMMATAINDWVESTWSVEQTYKLIHPVYELLGKPDNIAWIYRPGQHKAPPETAERFSQFMLAVANGENLAKAFPHTPFHIWDYDAWAKANPPTLDLAKLPARTLGDPTANDAGQPTSADQWPARRAEIRKQIDWLLGQGPVYQPMPVTFGQGESDEVAKVLARNWPNPPEKAQCRFGAGINGDIYYPSATAAGSGKKLPGVIWVGPFNTSGGYIGSYRSGDIAHITIARAGFVTMAFDAIGTGTRQEERREFYLRNPQWSLMGKMVLDVRNAIDALAQCPDVDPKQIYLVGYAMGGMVAELAAAQDDRVAGVASIAGFTPFRTDTDAAGTGGIRRYSHLYAWLPRLGAFVGQEAKAPVDFNEILACVAPRPMLVVQPQMDWHANPADVANAVSQARKAYALLGAGDNITLQSLDDWNRLTNDMLARTTTWLKAQQGK